MQGRGQNQAGSNDAASQNQIEKCETEIYPTFAKAFIQITGPKNIQQNTKNCVEALSKKKSLTTQTFAPYSLFSKCQHKRNIFIRYYLLPIESMDVYYSAKWKAGGFVFSVNN